MSKPEHDSENLNLSHEVITAMSNRRIILDYSLQLGLSSQQEIESTGYVKAANTINHYHPSYHPPQITASSETTVSGTQITSTVTPEHAYTDVDLARQRLQEVIDASLNGAN